MGQNSLNRDCLMICTNSLKIRFSIMKTRKKEFRSKLEKDYNLEKKALKKHEPFKAAFKRIAVILINGNEEKIDSEKDEEDQNNQKKKKSRKRKRENEENQGEEEEEVQHSDPPKKKRKINSGKSVVDKKAESLDEAEETELAELTKKEQEGTDLDKKEQKRLKKLLKKKKKMDKKKS